ncbi:MAG: patatin-like phospholipase family protein [Bacteroidota bacterium]
MEKFKILSVDGGGTRGIIPATILNCIFEDTGRTPIEIFDLFAGTSTGGILILSLAVGRKTYDIVDLYEDHAKDIFSDNKLDDIRDIGNLIGAQYSNTYLKQLLEDTYKNRTLGDINDKYNGKKKFLIPAFWLNPRDEEGRYSNFRPEVFNSYYIKHNNEKIVDLALRTSAGPTYFPMYQHFIDGGVAINHPAMAGVAFAINQHKSSKTAYCYHAPKEKGLKLNLTDLKVLSLGCGTSNGNYIHPSAIETGDWGLLQWKDFIAEMLTETNISASEYYVKQVLAPEDYLRCQLKFDAREAPEEIRGKKFGLDVREAKKLKAMKQYAMEYYDRNRNRILRFLDLEKR